MHVQRDRRARLVFGGMAFAAMLALSACGGGTSHAATVATSTTVAGGGNGQFGRRLSAFRDCMSSHGVTLPQRNRQGDGGPPSTTPGETFRPRNGGGFGGGRFLTPPAGVDAAKYTAALNACRSQLPTGFGNGGLNSTAFGAFTSCMKDHGVTISGPGGFRGLNRNDPKVQSALTTCGVLLPAGFNGGRSTATTTPGS
jgi:hypothetical protein